MSRRGKPIDELSVGTTVVSDAQCGVISVILIPVAGTASSIKLYDHASTATGNVKKQLTAGTANTSEAIVYCPSRPDAFSNGCVAVVAGADAKAYVSIEPV